MEVYVDQNVQYRVETLLITIPYILSVRFSSVTLPSCVFAGVSNSAFRHLMEFTYTATLAVDGEETFDVWKAAEYLQMEEAIKALDNK